MNKPSLKYVVSVTGLVCFCVSIFFLLPREPHASNIKSSTFTLLEKNRNRKKEDVIRYLDEIKNTAYTIANDENMLKFFYTFRKKKNAQNSNLEYAFDSYSVSKYGNFYDILFVDSAGDIYHSFRKESDWHTNIFTGPLSSTGLSKKLKTKKGGQFVGYEYYPPSEEPAAFIAVPVLKNEKNDGWFVLQYPINSVNSLLTDYTGLGRTGEVYLVNRDKLMLSDSRFTENSTILKKEINTQAVKEAVKRGAGRGVIRDYRGIRVFSSYEKFEYFGTEWIIISEIDEDEVITEHYQKFAKYYNEKILLYLAENRPKKHTSIGYLLEYNRVDMNEFARAEPGSKLKTYGVAACTGVSIMFPGRFCYLAHMVPGDKTYDRNGITNMFPGRIKADLLGSLLRKIRYRDVYQYEAKKLKFVIVAPHHNSFRGTVDEILQNGIELANIKFMYNPEARSANVLVDPSKNFVTAGWTDGRSDFYEYAVDTKDLGAIVKIISGYDKTSG